MDENEPMTEKDAEKLKDLQAKKKSLPILLGAFAVGGFIMGVAYGNYLKSADK